MASKIDGKRVGIYLGFSFGIAWLVGLGVYLISQQNPGGSAQLGITLLIAVGYMWSPALGNILTRLVTHEGWRGAFLRPNFRLGWPYWLIAWILPVVLTAAGVALYYWVLPQYFDASMPMMQEQYARAGLTFSMPTWIFLLGQLVNVLVIGLVVNSLATFGEEFGWRAYLLQKLMPLGTRKAVLLTGVIWGIWHWPLTAQGHNFGLDYVGFPWLGMLVMVVFTVGLGTIFAWLALRGGSVWPAVIGHSIINAVGAVGLLWVSGDPNLLFGPSPAGMLAGVPILVMAVALLLSPKAWKIDEVEGPAEQIVSDFANK